MDEAAQLSTIAANCVTIVGGLGIIATCVSTLYALTVKGWKALSALISLGENAARLESVAQGFEGVKKSVDEMKVGQEELKRDQAEIKKQITRMDSELKDVREKMLTKTQFDLPPPGTSM